VAAVFAAATAQAAATAVVPLDLSGPRPIAMLSVGEAPPVRVIFDTGASGNVIDIDYARSIGLPDEGRAAVHTPAGGPPIEGFRTMIAAGRLGGAPLSNARAVALSSPALQHLEVRGVFGPSTFSGRLVHLDLARGEVRITDKTPELIPAGPASPYNGGGDRLPGLPGIAVNVAGQRFDGHIDTGQPGLLMMPLAMASRVPLDGELRQAARPARMADGVPRPLFEGRIRGTVRIGPLTFENPEVRFMDGLQRVNVGMQALRGVIVVLDPAESRSWLVRPS
jgi:predicted aspartyl protease